MKSEFYEVVEGARVEAAVHWNRFFLPRALRVKYGFEGYLADGQLQEARPHLAGIRELSYKLRTHAPESKANLSAGQLNALVLIHLAWGALIEAHCNKVGADLQTMVILRDSSTSAEKLEQLVATFLNAFPPVLNQAHDLQDVSGVDHPNQPEALNLAISEMTLVWLKNQNPAASGFREVFDDRFLVETSSYDQIIAALRGRGEDQEGQPTSGQDWLDDLLEPVRKHPNSLDKQLEYMFTAWPDLIKALPQNLYLQALDLLKEEYKFNPMGPGLVSPPAISASEGEYEEDRFTADLDWMPSLVLIAKNAYVWLDQLSRQYAAEINRLDEIPDSTLDELQTRGITGLWLIGLWQRSPASKRIKQLMGDEAAVASAYSLYDYSVADDLGGQEALENLKTRAWQRGIRLASDMVPNHMGLDSRWVVDHPEWFLSLSESPFPGYSFNGPDLSADSRVGIFLEDHYYDRSDAAVVFRRVDKASGNEQYIYHGNDGTSMPWNDTAQLNYLRADVREAVIQTILHVARQFPIIRFDAAMTLARKHVQRLWFPEPGSGGDIPSRTEHGLPKDKFYALMPREFWQEVVERVALEAPDTLLLAEAFWMMEGYFVRTLGMHRVYNSAFMHMIRDERNREYRQALKDTLAFNPQILKRYVNFLNNPDEETAAEQFGTTDKYFAASTLMATLPGLPMLGHGQLEGYTEKYGMEYRFAKLHEETNCGLLEQHERRIFPLLRQRRLFASVEDFQFYDARSTDSQVLENVFAYSNSHGPQKCLVLVHNSNQSASGHIHAAISGIENIRPSVGSALGLPMDGSAFVIARELNTGTEYLWNCAELRQRGLEFSLGPYECLVFLEFQVMYSTPTMPLWALHARISGKAVPSVQIALEELAREPVLSPFRDLLGSNLLNQPDKGLFKSIQKDGVHGRLEELNESYLKFLTALNSEVGGDAPVKELADKFQVQLAAVARLGKISDFYQLNKSRNFKAAENYLRRGMENPDSLKRLLLALMLEPIGQCSGAAQYWEVSRGWAREWHLSRLLSERLNQSEINVAQIEAVIGRANWYPILFEEKTSRSRVPKVGAANWLNDPYICRAIGKNNFDGVEWFSEDAMNDWLWLTYAYTAVQVLCEVAEENVAVELARIFGQVNQLRKLANQSQFRIDELHQMWEKK